MTDPYASIAKIDEELQLRLVQALELRAADPLQDGMLKSYLAELSLPEGARVLEVGSGTGAVCRVLASLPGVGSVRGVDPSAVFVEKATELSAGLDNVTFAVGDGQALDAGDSEFDLVVFHTTLCHVPDPQKALAEAVRVLKPGGVLAVFDGDYMTTTIALDAADPLQQPIEAVMRHYVQHPWLSRQLPRLLTSLGLTVESFRSHGYTRVANVAYFMSLLDRGLDLMMARGTLGAESAAALRQEATARDAAGSFFGHITYISAISRKP